MSPIAQRSIDTFHPKIPSSYPKQNIYTLLTETDAFDTKFVNENKQKDAEIRTNFKFFLINILCVPSKLLTNMCAKAFALAWLFQSTVGRNVGCSEQQLRVDCKQMAACLF